MIYWVAVVVGSIPFLLWLWHVAPKRVEDTYVDYRTYKVVKTGKFRWVHYFESWWTAVLGTLGILAAWFATIVFVIPLIFAGIMNIAISDFQIKSEESTDLIALKTDSATNGQFAGGIFLSAGYISEDPTFNFLYETDDKGVKVGQVYAYNATVYEDEQDNPHYTEFTWVKYDEFWAPFAANQDTTYAFHVPEGSVVSNYEVKP